MHFASAARLALTLTVLAGWSVHAQKAIEVAGVRLDDAFRLAGSNSAGLVVSVTVNDLKPHTTTDNFLVRLFDDAGRPSGDLACLAMRSLQDAGGPAPPWLLLDSAEGTLQRSYAALLASKAATIQKSRRRPIEKAGRYEFVFLIGPNAKQGALLFGADGPDVARLPVGSFKIPSR
jgi:hypothetical protein